MIIKDDTSVNEEYWGLKHKFKLEVGLKNTVDTNKYPDIIWFPQGVYIVSSFNVSHATNNATISISGKDKMCLLNGDFGGSLPASIDFATIGNADGTITKIPIFNIIREMLHAYAQEAYENIIINDLDNIAVELLEYRGNVPLYMVRNVATGEFENYTLNGDKQGKIVGGAGSEGTPTVALKNIKSVGGLYDPRVNLDYKKNNKDNGSSELTFGDNTTKYTVAEVTYGQTAGYRRTDLTYPGELMSNIGESITSILDKIKNVLGEFEYFYNLDGQFIFQRKKNYIQNSWNNIVKIGSEMYAENAAYTSALSYEFTDNTLVTSFNNPPNLTNLKNDFTVWGNRKGVSGIDLPVHYRYAIDHKPNEYNGITDEDVDWRELIYLMAVDYYQHDQEDEYIPTGYEQYFLDMQGFWRELYHPGAFNKKYITDKEKKKMATQSLKENGILDPTEIIVEAQMTTMEANNEYQTILLKEYETDGWHKQVREAPDQLNFWFDFLDTESELGQFNVKEIGIRSKVVNDKDVTSIYFKEVPQVVFVKPGSVSDYLQEYKSATGYTIVNAVSGLEDMFSISAQGKSAQEALDSLLYNHSYCIESISLKTIPIYHLEPNTRIFVKDEVSKIDGDYIISKISIPLTYNGQMSINATKAPSRLI